MCSYCCSDTHTRPHWSQSFRIQTHPASDYREGNSLHSLVLILKVKTKKKVLVFRMCTTITVIITSRLCVYFGFYRRVSIRYNYVTHSERRESISNRCPLSQFVDEDRQLTVPRTWPLDQLTSPLCYSYTMHPAATAITFQATMDKTGWTWDNAGDGMGKRDRPWLPWMPGQIFN